MMLTIRFEFRYFRDGSGWCVSASFFDGRYTEPVVGLLALFGRGHLSATVTSVSAFRWTGKLGYPPHAWEPHTATITQTPIVSSPLADTSRPRRNREKDPSDHRRERKADTPRTPEPAGYN
ncbi:hypothetical protein MTP99_018321 [Tenebrio molitor]|nr:hypothetical protein MTP99_018321 [Tenebrio molitor]